MIIRSVDMLGINVVSLEDLSIKESIDFMHMKPILEILILNDQKTIVTTGRDKKISIWNLHRKVLIATKSDH